MKWGGEYFKGWPNVQMCDAFLSRAKQRKRRMIGVVGSRPVSRNEMHMMHFLKGNSAMMSSMTATFTATKLAVCVSLCG